MSEAARALVVEFYLSGLLLFGCLVLFVAWLPLLIQKLPLSLPILCIGAGAVLFSLPTLRPFAFHPINTPVVIEKATEFIVIISLMGAGLKIGRPFAWRGWGLTWRLIFVAMPLTILALMALGMGVLGLVPSTALLLAACLAPTDPVLAGDVQIERPGETEEEDEARFALTSEAGLNDAAAFPFVHLALALAVTGWSWATWREFLLEDLLQRLSLGLLIGLLAGKALGWVIYRLPGGTRLSKTGDGFVALGATLAVYAATELVHGYGFLAVFVAGLMMRHESRDAGYNERMHDFADEVERLTMMTLLLFFGGMLTAGGLLAGVAWQQVVFAVACLLVVRPIAAGLSLIGHPASKPERAIVAFFGIRGLGSVFYLAYALNHHVFVEAQVLWSTLGLIILISIVLHGTTVTPALNWMERWRERVGWDGNTPRTPPEPHPLP